MTFQQIVEQYFKELKKEISVGISTGEATEELSYRMSLDNFFKNVAEAIDKNIDRIHEPKNQGKLGRPDWRFHNSDSMGVYGYVEAKGLDSKKEIKVSEYESQVERYLVLENPVILTDGIDFVLFNQEGQRKKFSLCHKPINWEKPELDFEAEVLFKIFFKKVGYRKVTENQLVNEVAKRARRLSDEILELLDLEDDEGETKAERATIKLLRELKNAAEQSHDKSLIDDKIFAGFIAQILTFGLLYAHRIVDKSAKNPKDKYKKIHDFWFSVMEDDYSNKLIPFKTLVKELKSELDSDLSRLGIWYDDLRRLLAHIQLTSEQIELPDFHELYETFLSVYDPKTRFDYGAYYTPRSLAFYTVNLVKSVIHKTLPNLKLETTKHKIIDPCCGTGTFIEAILRNFNLRSNSSIIGFEILPAPYALAHYRMTMLREKYPDNIKIILTNTLSDNLFEEVQIKKGDSDISALLLQEQQVAYQLANPPLTIIIGNPPSSDSKFQVGNEGEIINKLMEDFKPGIINRRARQNTQKQLTNEFVKFIRWTIDRAEKSLPSLFALILPSGFIKYNSYEFARKYIVEHVSELWILEFDTDNRTGADASNVFNTLQGRLILIGVLKSEIGKKLLINYKSICNLNRQQKYDFFNSEVSLEGWTTISQLDEHYSFKPASDYDAEMYDRFWALTAEDDGGIFLRHCSSLKLAPTHLLVHASEGQLKRRSRFIAKLENNYATIKERWYSGQQKPPPEKKINDSVKNKLGKAITAQNIFKYSYRPFLETYVLLGEDLLDELGKTEGGGLRDRPEIRAAYKNKNVFGFAVAPAPEDLGESLHKFSSFCWNVPDNDLSTRGNAHIFCNYFPDYKKKKNWDSNVKTNINPNLLAALSRKFAIKEEKLINPLTFYAYAILSSNFYLEQFKGKLYNVAGEWPGIPITEEKDLFFAVAEFGKQLAELESGNYKGKTRKDDLAELEYHKYKIETNSIRLFDEKGNLVKQYFDIDEDTLQFEVSGYNVVREWLKLHSYPYYRKNLEEEELNEFHMLLSKIDLYRTIILELDNKVEQILDSKLLEKSAV
jgi:hypothetical protein